MSGFTSVWDGNDNGFLREAIPFYLRESYCPQRTVILDSTFGLGVFWRPGTPEGWTLISMDINPVKPAAVIADNGRMPFRDGVFNVVVNDFPHVTHDWSPWDSAGQYAVAAGRGSIAYLYPPFLAEAHRVLTADGIVIAKIADQVHSGRSWFQTGEFVAMLPAYGFTACDLIVKVRSHARPQPPGRRTLHAARRHSFYVIARKGKGC